MFIITLLENEYSEDPDNDQDLTERILKDSLVYVPPNSYYTSANLGPYKFRRASVYL